MKKRKYWLIVLLISILTVIVGYFLWGILIPIPDFGSLTQEEVLVLQKEVALNYELGRAMMWTGVCGICVSIFLFFKR